jgi:shikimate kinase
MNHRAPIFLVGFMASGKSEVGRRLARRLELPFYDLDAEVEAAAGATIAEQFARDGETAFREREAAALERACAACAGGGVIATGGGLYANAAHRARIQRAGGIAVWLDAPLEELERRFVRDGSRPRWGTRDEVARLFAERASAYAGADLRVDAATGDADAVAARIVAALEDLGGLAWKSSTP